jgi:hypothetical protein
MLSLEDMLVWHKELCPPLEGKLPMQFYNLKTRSHVDVPDKDIKKKKMVRKTKSGEQTRYALLADYQGTTLYKFVNEATYKDSKADEVS